MSGLEGRVFYPQRFTLMNTKVWFGLVPFLTMSTSRMTLQIQAKAPAPNITATFAFFFLFMYRLQVRGIGAIKMIASDRTEMTESARIRAR